MRARMVTPHFCRHPSCLCRSGECWRSLRCLAGRTTKNIPTADLVGKVSQRGKAAEEHQPLGVQVKPLTQDLLRCSLTLPWQEKWYDKRRSAADTGRGMP